jgi:hypothetical protein
MILFAYASNMNVDELATHVTSAKKIDIGYLRGYSFSFNRTADDLSAKANIITCDELDAKVWGVLIELSDEDKAKFFHSTDDLQLLPVTCYDTKDKPYDAEVFITPPHATNNYLLPYDWYQEKISTFARWQNLPEDYINDLLRKESKPDPDEKRKKRRLSKFKK